MPYKRYMFTDRENRSSQIKENGMKHEGMQVPFRRDGGNARLNLHKAHFDLRISRQIRAGFLAGLQHRLLCRARETGDCMGGVLKAAASRQRERERR